MCLTFQYATDFEIPISIGLFYQKSTISNRGTNGAKVFAKPRNPESKNGDYFRVVGVDFFVERPLHESTPYTQHYSFSYTETQPNFQWGYMSANRGTNGAQC